MKRPWKECKTIEIVSFASGEQSNLNVRSMTAQEEKGIDPRAYDKYMKKN